MGELGRCAWGDESFSEHATGGFYVLASVVFAPELLAEIRRVLTGMRGARRTQKLHFNEMDPAQQRRAAKQLADLEGLHVVVIGAPVPRRRQERARAMCLRSLVCELHGLGVDTLYLEGREPELNQRDVRTVAGVRQSLLPKGTRFRVEHCPGGLEPLLWAADIVAGACRSAEQGLTECRQLLDERIYDLRVDTGA